MRCMRGWSSSLQSCGSARSSAKRLLTVSGVARKLPLPLPLPAAAATWQGLRRHVAAGVHDASNSMFGAEMMRVFTVRLALA